MTAEFWAVVERDEDRGELDRLAEIGRRLGDGIDDQADEEGFDDIAEYATRADIGASFADATGSTGAMFKALENLKRLCDELGLRGNDASQQVRQEDAASGDEPEVALSPSGHPAGTVVLDEARVRLPDDPFRSLNCDFRERGIEGIGTAYYCVGRQASGRTLEVNAFDDGTGVVWGIGVGGPDCEGVSGCTYSNAVDQSELRAEVASIAGGDADSVDCDAGYWPGHRVPPGGRIGCRLAEMEQVIEAKVLADDRFEIIR